METDKYRILLRAVDLGSFSAVADEYGYTPSGVVHMMNSIEDQFGFPLLIRSNKGIRLTEDGKRLIPVLRELIQSEENLNQAVSEINGVVTGDITIGSFFSIASEWLPKTILHFQKDYPNVKIHIKEAVHQGLDQMLEEQKVDFCLYSAPSVKNIEWIPLKEDRMVAVIPANHRRAGSKAFPIEELADEPFIMPANGYDYEVTSTLSKYNIDLKVSYSTGEDHAAISMIAEGLGIGVFNELTTISHTADVVRLPLDPPDSIMLGIAVPSDKKMSPAARIFIKYLKLTCQGAFDK